MNARRVLLAAAITIASCACSPGAVDRYRAGASVRRHRAASGRLHTPFAVLVRRTTAPTLGTGPMAQACQPRRDGDSAPSLPLPEAFIRRPATTTSRPVRPPEAPPNTTTLSVSRSPKPKHLASGTGWPAQFTVDQAAVAGKTPLRRRHVGQCRAGDGPRGRCGVQRDQRVVPTGDRHYGDPALDGRARRRRKPSQHVRVGISQRQFPGLWPGCGRRQPSCFRLRTGRSTPPPDRRQSLKRPAPPATSSFPSSTTAGEPSQ